jgi:hypothetical protein
VVCSADTIIFSGGKDLSFQCFQYLLSLNYNYTTVILIKYPT